MKRIEQLIFAQAERYPDRIAVECNGERLTYEQLRNNALLISRGLQNLGLQRGGAVVIFQDRSLETLPLVLGIWNAGGVVVPINPNTPVKLLEWMIQSSSPSIIVTEGALKDRTVSAVDTISSKPVILEAAASTNGTFSTVNGSHEAAALDHEQNDDDDACYIIFTSGSEGRPKGVCGSHRSLLHYLQWQAKEFSVTETDRFSQIAPLSFDFSLKEFLVPFISGASVCIADTNTVMNPRKFVEWAAEARLTVMCCVPTLLRSILELADDDLTRRAFQHVRSVLISGEMLRWEDVNTWRKRFGSSISLFNLYGPTESTVIKLCYPIPETRSPGSVNVPVGRPIDGTQVLVLEAGDRHCETGEIGEVVIVSDNLARGYVNSGVASNSFCRIDVNGDRKRAYRTGDLGRWLPSGDLELMGRKDRQVKIRGYRVELDELESVISEHPSLHDVAVVACTSANADDDGRALIGCYFSCNGSEVTEKEIREFARDRMLPQVLSLTQFSRLEKLPLTANGKVNRRELEALFEAGETRVAEPAQPVETPDVHQQILAMWLDLLTIESVDPEANFFELGGDSMLAIRLLRRLREELHPQINLGDVYEFPTVSQLSARVSQLSA
ncbi:MAG TPA: non-ribosomal peptide synthetase [Pyrinomonadaceae bacterium]|nr:non-ribosomal peptide synthetase [Pyrinomonadaceae bacterium]